MENRPPRTLLCVKYRVEDSHYPNVGARGTHPAAQRVYWRNLAVMFASARRFGGAGFEARVATNVDPPPDVARVLARLEVEVRRTDFAYTPPRDYFGQYRGAFTTFDVITAFAREAAPTDRLLILDPDCLWAGDPARLVGVLRDHDLAVYEIGLLPHAREHGLTTGELFALFAEFAPFAATRAPRRPAYLGGEVVGMTGEAAARLVPVLESAWRRCLERHAEGRPTFRTEEQLLSFAVWASGLSARDLRPEFRRILTSPLFANPEPEDLQRVLWHLPLEKRRGLLHLFPDAAREGSPFWTLPEEAFRRDVARRVGLLPTPWRRWQDRAFRVAWHARDRWRRARRSRPTGGLAKARS